tara:strand:+ start:226 stop:1233 length:1008 start_codon:yes stop_codon:yes gene_type:complete
MSNWIERLKEEKSELEVRIKSLYEFMTSSAYQKLDSIEKYLVKEQSNIMENYLSLIRDRMGRTKTSNVLKAKEVFEDAMDEHEITFHSSSEGVRAFQAAVDEYVESSKSKDEGLIEELIKEMKEISQEEWASIKGKGLFAQMNDESLKYAKMSEKLQKAVKEMPTEGWISDGDKKISQDMVNHIAKKVLLKDEMPPASMSDEQLAEGSKRFVRDERTGEPMWYSEEDYREWHKLLTERQRMVLPEDVTESKDDITQTEITPKALIVLGFEENYQGVDMGNPGYIYYTLYILDVEFISTSLEDDGPFHVMFGNNCQFSICNLRKLEDLILSLKEVS